MTQDETAAAKTKSGSDLGAHLRTDLSAGMSVALFGGSFDPPHAGHRLVSLTALKALHLDRIWWLVSPQNPLKKHAPQDSATRVATCRAVAAHPRIYVSDEESRLGTRYTIDTVRRLKARHPGVRFIWLMGADNLVDLHKWKFWDELMQEVPMAIYPRTGSTLQAGLSPAATRFARWRKATAQAAHFKYFDAPAWIVLNGVLNGLSSSALRQMQR